MNNINNVNNNVLIYLTPHENILITLMEIFTITTVYIIILWGVEKVREVNNNNVRGYLTPHENILTSPK